MTFVSTLRRTLFITLASLMLSAPAALARPADLRSEAPTFSLFGTTDEGLERSLDPFLEPTSRTDRALAQERYYASYGALAPLSASLAQGRYYASYGEPAPLSKAASTVAADTGDGIARLAFVLAVLGALVVGLGAGSGLYLVYVRRSHGTGLAT